MHNQKLKRVHSHGKQICKVSASTGQFWRVVSALTILLEISLTAAVRRIKTALFSWILLT